MEAGAAVGAVGATGGGAAPDDEAAGAPPKGVAGASPGGATGAPPPLAILGCSPRRKSRPPGLTRTSSGGPGCPRRSMCVPRSSWKRLTTSVKLGESPGPLNSRLSRSLRGLKCSGAQRRSRPCTTTQTVPVGGSPGSWCRERSCASTTAGPNHAPLDLVVMVVLPCLAETRDAFRLSARQ